MASPQASQATIYLKVKVPPGYMADGQEEFALGSVAVSSTVGTLRQQLQHVIPTHPEPSRQRLLYGGRALVDDEQTIADALNVKRDTSQTDFVVHLVVRDNGANGVLGGQHGHRRIVNTAAIPVPGAQQITQQQPAQAQQPAVGPPHTQHPPNVSLLTRQLQHQNQTLMQQLALAQRSGMPLPPAFNGAQPYHNMSPLPPFDASQNET